MERAMYGSIMRARVQPGKRSEFEALMTEIASDHRAHGLVRFEIAWEVADPDAFLAIIHFPDRDSYARNGSRPETDADFRRQLELLDGEPQWIDVDFGVLIGTGPTSA